MDTFLVWYLGPLLFCFLSGIVLGRWRNQPEDGRACASQSFIPVWNILVVVSILIEFFPYLGECITDFGNKVLYWIIPDKDKK